MKRKGALVVEGETPEDCQVFSGFLLGSPVSEEAYLEDQGYGEIVFNTAMVGYQEVLTDPSYFGQLVCMTASHIGNTGINSHDMESRQAWCSGLIMHEHCERASSWRAEEELEDFLIRQRIPAISGIDTRALTRLIRSRGAMRGLILPVEEQQKAWELFQKLPLIEGRDLVQSVTTPTSYRVSSTDSAKFSVVAIDYGMKQRILHHLSEHQCDVQVVSAQTSAQAILDAKPDGVFLSNGPGDPAAIPYAIDTLRGILNKIPIFGICMGHQILAQALGARTYKLKFGHHGINQPVFENNEGKVEISSHNHSFAVDEASLPEGAFPTHWNLNDRTLEGLMAPQQSAFSVQYHPEASPGPHDSYYLFDRFCQMMENGGRLLST